MSGRAGQLGIAEQLRIGRMVLRLRAKGAPWKLLALRLGRSDEQLRRYAQRARQKDERCKASALASATPRVKEWPLHQVAGALLADSARSSAQQPARQQAT